MKKIFYVVVITITFVLFSGLTSCKSPSTWQNELGIIWPQSMCSNHGKDCQTHWLLCSAGCVEVYNGHSRTKRVDGATIKQRCSRYTKHIRSMCEDVRGVSWEDAVCWDYKTGWCSDYATTCDERPTGCKQ